jgi:hypothetical protein
MVIARRELNHWAKEVEAQAEAQASTPAAQATA